MFSCDEAKAKQAMTKELESQSEFRYEQEQEQEQGELTTEEKDGTKTGDTSDANEVEHALLETLFYNEMMLLGGGNPGIDWNEDDLDNFNFSSVRSTPPSSSTSSTPSSVQQNEHGSNPSSINSGMTSSVNFGVLSDGGGLPLPARQDTHVAPPSAGGQQNCPNPAPALHSDVAFGGLYGVYTPDPSQIAPMAASDATLPRAVGPTTSRPVSILPTTATETAPAWNFQSQLQQPTTIMVTPLSGHMQMQMQMQPYVLQQQQYGGHAAYAYPISHVSTGPTAVPSPAATSTLTFNRHQHAKQLVNQFATLASRLGISLPNNVLTNLTAAAAMSEINSDEQQSAMGETTSTDVKGELRRVENYAKETEAMLSSPPESTFVRQLQNTAEAAIATVAESKQRTVAGPLSTACSPAITISSAVQKPTATRFDVASPTSDQDDHHYESSAATSSPNRPAHYRRKKKPRLEDCETKLEALRAENAMLKRHLDNVTNRTARFDQVRQQAEREMRELVMQYDAASNSQNSLTTALSTTLSNTEKKKVLPTDNQQELNDILHKFTEMYSDYGHHRHDELTFHFHQLEKLSSPTTFTKMSLWTLSQSESFFTKPNIHPIAGILRKELDISPAQGHKIIAQRYKIKKLCDNMKQCLTLIATLKQLCVYKQQRFKDRMTKVQTILTPLQVVKLLIWIDDHAGVLERVCPGWGSERIPGNLPSAGSKRNGKNNKANTVSKMEKSATKSTTESAPT